MPPSLISTGLLILALIIYLYACKILIEDARHNYSLTMGAEMYFSQLWVIASVLAACGAIRLLHLSWWLLPPAVILLYLPSLPLRRVIARLFLGMDYPASGTTSNNSSDHSDIK